MGVEKRLMEEVSEPWVKISIGMRERGRHKGQLRTWHAQEMTGGAGDWLSMVQSREKVFVLCIVVPCPQFTFGVSVTFGQLWPKNNNFKVPGIIHKFQIILS
jgi:hypothetical protein